MLKLATNCLLLTVIDEVSSVFWLTMRVLVQMNFKLLGTLAQVGFGACCTREALVQQDQQQ
jgi:hypothetical protein